MDIEITDNECELTDLEKDLLPFLKNEKTQLPVKPKE